MQKVVSNGLKIDLHIHSIVSSHKDGTKVISKLEIEEINTQYFLSLVSRTLKAGKTINWMTITESELQDALLKYDNTPVLQFFSNALHTLIEADLRPKNSIIYQGMDKYAEMSSGLDAKIYFDLLSYEMQQDGIYIIDQPEDNISQNAIREYLLDRFKTMGENRQVIMVTHNPQFIVNLDVDNLIFLSKKMVCLAYNQAHLNMCVLNTACLISLRKILMAD